MAGQILGDRYKVEKQLGRQAGRWTLLATNIETETPVILKMISIDDDLHPDTVKLFEREVEILRSLNHPSIPKHLDYFEIDLPKQMKAMVLVQSYIEGVSVDKYLKKGRLFSEAEVQKVARAILRILIYLHNNEPSIIHRDIKPSNILISSTSEENPSEQKSQIYLVDFGSVKRLASKPSNTTIMSLVGDENYMAPELMSGRGLLTSDLYSLGMSLVNLLTGLPPSEFPRKNSKIDVAQFESCSTAFGEWIQRMTELTVSSRYSSAQEALDVLKGLANA
ncbi:MAG: serine/threonine-protein kinase [Leptolyngbyaceae bacterium]|nr:serine/threonine-protein kinase [Leptolyngbyaceae bacterium]